MSMCCHFMIKPKGINGLEAFEALKSKLVDGQIVVERVVPKLANLSFCKKGKPSAMATSRYNEILNNLRR